ncbi:SDR family NAD(P)-dependent oxidoreductase [Lysobacter cavernae]|uniref:SDR family NAD(P)-dependent oxidoreductase n=1 Tax=Lysobacter cavernae TaxID=1685901 RepID=A0ABV7RRE6_9GAMM
MLLENKTAVIYGAGGAIGGATARTFAREGAQVFLAGRTPARLQAVARDIVAADGHAEVATLDVLDQAAVDAHADAIAEATGGIDITFNAVGFTHVQGPPLAELTLQDFMHPVDAYARAHFIVAKAVARHMATRGGGVILSLSTPGARMSGTGFLGNGVASAAVEAFSRLLAGELGASGIRVVCLRPHAIPEAVAHSHTREVFAGFAQRTGLSIEEMLATHAQTGTLLKRLPTLQEVADTATFVASDRAGAMTGAIVNLSCGALVD